MSPQLQHPLPRDLPQRGVTLVRNALADLELQHAREAAQAHVTRLQEAAISLGQSARDLGQSARAAVPARSSFPDCQVWQRPAAALTCRESGSRAAARAAARLKAQFSARGGRVMPTSMITCAGCMCRCQSQRESLIDGECDGKAAWTSSHQAAAGRPQGYRASEGTVVTLHVYDALWVATADTKLPVVHLGVEVYGNEFSFGETGIKAARPGLYDAQRHRCTMALGRTFLSRRDVYRVISELKKAWPGDDYRLIGNNCQSFALQLCDKLGLGDDSIPSHYVYFAKPILSPLGSAMPMAIVQHSGSRSGGISNSCNSCGNCSGDLEILEAEITGELLDVSPFIQTPHVAETGGVDFI